MDRQVNMRIEIHTGSVTPSQILHHWATLMLGRKEMFYLMTHSTHFIYGYMASDIW